jgi:hypothetical protein
MLGISSGLAAEMLPICPFNGSVMSDVWPE